METLFPLKNYHLGCFLHLMVDVAPADDLISLHFSQYAWYDIVVELATYSLHVNLLEWLEILEDDLEGGTLFEAVGVDSHCYVVHLGFALRSKLLLRLITINLITLTLFFLCLFAILLGFG